jgi:hypothetical protein
MEAVISSACTPSTLEHVSTASYVRLFAKMNAFVDKMASPKVLTGARYTGVQLYICLTTYCHKENSYWKGNICLPVTSLKLPNFCVYIKRYMTNLIRLEAAQCNIYLHEAKTELPLPHFNRSKNKVIRPTYLWFYSPLSDLGRFFSSPNPIQSR